MKRISIILIALSCVLFLYHLTFRTRLISHIQYLKWRELGGTEFKDNFYSELIWDQNSHRAIDTLSIKQILEKYPHIVNSTDLEAGSYKRNVYDSQKWNLEYYELYWMTPDDIWAGWCIEIKGTNSSVLRLIKG